MSTPQTVDPEVIALKVMLRLSKVLEPGSNAEALLSKAKDLPSLMVSAGITQALTFYLSKAKIQGKREVCFKNLLEYLLGNTSISKDTISCLKNDVVGEGKGYLTMLALTTATLTKILNDLNKQNKEQEKACSDLGSPKNIAGCLLYFLEDKENPEEDLILIEKKLVESLTIIKRLVEALYTSSGFPQKN